MRASIASIRLQARGTVTSIFQVVAKDLGTTRDGKAFLRLVLADSSGQLPALIWDNAEAASGQFDVGNILEIAGELTTYRNEMQIRLERIRRREFATLAPEERPSLDQQMLCGERAIDCDGAWVFTLLDPSEAARIATERKIKEIAAKYSGAQPDSSQPEKPSSQPITKREPNARIAHLVRKYSSGDQEKF